MRLGRAVDLYSFDFSCQRNDSTCERAIPPEPIMPTTFGVFTRHVFGADARVGTHPHMLQVTVIDQRQRFAVLILLSKIKPQNLPGRTQYFSWVIAP